MFVLEGAGVVLEGDLEHPLKAGDFVPVSYTHLTLPTSDLV